MSTIAVITLSTMALAALVLSVVMIREYLNDRPVVVRSKRDSLLMRALGWVFNLVGYDFMRRAWTTIGSRTIYAPTTVPQAKIDDYNNGWTHSLNGHPRPLEHEMIHTRQAKRYPIIWQVSYLLLPVPVLFAWFRWRWEREAYLNDITKYGRDVDEVVDVMWSIYGWCWPKPLMRRWFKRRAGR
uniref:Uncharacterized protein n=2 Tax=viral metagenome TaxID=1070528 RepID=A0A6M3KYG0_9ZZZZ